MVILNKKQQLNKQAAKHPLMKSLRYKPRNGKVFICPICKKEFYLKPYLAKQSVVHCCSRKCQHIHQIKRVLLNCQYCGKEYSVPPSQIKWRGSSFCSRKCQGLWKSKYEIGSKSSGWKGGKSNIYKRLRSSKKFKEWRKKVFERDNYICQICGARSKVGHPVFLHPHHLKSFTLYPKLRFDVNNGQTVCVKCHFKIHYPKRYEKQETIITEESRPIVVS